MKKTKEVTYDQVYAEVEKLGINSQSEEYRTCSLLTVLIFQTIKHPEQDLNDRIAVAESSMGDLPISSQRSRWQLEEKLHRSDLPEELFAGDVLENTISYIMEKLK